MVIEFTVEGGIAYFPGLAKPVVIDTALLPAQEAAEVEQLINFARNVKTGQPAKTKKKARTRGADLRRYRVTIREETGAVTLQFADPIVIPELATLIRKLEAIARPSR